jgi:hypothetical protein
VREKTGWGKEINARPFFNYFPTKIEFHFKINLVCKKNPAANIQDKNSFCNYLSLNFGR